MESNNSPSISLPENESQKTPIKHNFYVRVSKKRIKQLEREAKIGRFLLEKTKQKKYITSPYAKFVGRYNFIFYRKFSC